MVSNGLHCVKTLLAVSHPQMGQLSHVAASASSSCSKPKTTKERHLSFMCCEQTALHWKQCRIALTMSVVVSSDVYRPAENFILLVKQLEVVSVVDTFYQCMFDTVYNNVTPINKFHEQRFGVSENRLVLTFFNSWDWNKSPQLQCLSLIKWLMPHETCLISLYNRLERPRAGRRWFKWCCMR